MRPLLHASSESTCSAVVASMAPLTRYLRSVRLVRVRRGLVLVREEPFMTLLYSRMTLPSVKALSMGSAAGVLALVSSEKQQCFFLINYDNFSVFNFYNFQLLSVFTSIKVLKRESIQHSSDFEGRLEKTDLPWWQG